MNRYEFIFDNGKTIKAEGKTIFQAWQQLGFSGEQLEKLEYCRKITNTCSEIIGGLDFSEQFRKQARNRFIQSTIPLEDDE